MADGKEVDLSAAVARVQKAASAAPTTGSPLVVARADDLRALLAAVAPAEPVAWQYSEYDEVDGWGGWSDIRPGDLATVREWVGRDTANRRIRELYAAPAADARDAARYRWLANSATSEWSHMQHIRLARGVAALDAAIDKAMEQR